MADATFRIGYSSSLSGPWTWGAYGAAVDVTQGYYCKVQLESGAVSTFQCTIPSGDAASIDATLPTVTTDAGTKTATFLVPSRACCLLVQVRVNQGAADEATSSLAVHVLTSGGLRLAAVGEQFEADSVAGWNRKFNAAITAVGWGGSSNLLALDFSAQASQTLSADATPYTVAGMTCTRRNQANDATAMALTSGSGLIIAPVVSGDTSNVSAGTFGAPSFDIPLTEISSQITVHTPLQMLAYVSAWNGAAAFDWCSVGINDLDDGKLYNVGARIEFNSGRQICPAYNYASGNVVNPVSAGTDHATDNVLCLTFPAGIAGLSFTMSSATYSTWPAETLLTPKYLYNQVSISPALKTIDKYAISLMCGAGDTGTTGLSTTFKYLRVNAL